MTQQDSPEVTPEVSPEAAYEKELFISPGPHLWKGLSVSQIMYYVVYALLLPAGAGVYFFGYRALSVMGVSIGTAIITEYLTKKLRGQAFVMDGSAVITGLLLAYQMLRTLWLFIGILIAGGMLMRWRAIQAAAGSPDGQVVVAGGGKDLPEAEGQVRKLFRFLVALIAAFWLFAIWSSAVPALQIMKRVELWPQVALVEAAKSDPLAPVTGEKPAASGKTDKPVEEGSSSPSPAIPGLPTGEAATATATPDAPPLTLWEVFQCLLALLIVVVLSPASSGMPSIAVPGSISKGRSTKTSESVGTWFAGSITR